MLTIRTSLILGAAATGLLVGMLGRHEPLSLISLAILFWIWIEWLSFQRFKLANPVLQGCTRTIDGQSDSRVTMVADRDVKVRVSGTLPMASRGYRFLVHDMLPDTFQVTNGLPYSVIDSGIGSQFELAYTATTALCGKVAFPGICIEVSDYWGFFRTEHFVPIAQEPTVLPYLIRPQTTVSVLKHNNLQRHIGHHRNMSSGLSSELLGIRDYRIGDPPRTIAWKPTARLGKVMTCEYENEVPIRATILVDLAVYQFQGRPRPSAADRAIMSCAAIAKLLLADRDPVAAILLRSDSVERIKHGGGERQLTRILQYLLAASNPNPPLDHMKIDDLIKLVYENGSRRFPELFDEFFNYGPVRRNLFRLGASRADRSRRSLAVVLEHLLKWAPGTSTRMQVDDDLIRTACLKYVDKFSVVASATNVTVNPPWSDPGSWQRESREMTTKLTQTLLQANTQAKDNELFVVVAPEPFDFECEDLFVNTLRTVVAAGHRVIFVAPMVPPVQARIHDPLAAEILSEAKTEDMRNRDSRFRDRVSQLGVAFSRIDNPELMKLVAMEVGVLQSASGRRRVLRAR
ncbi:DUF58 domain-containing protein [Mariniblastus fucicola]|uniref:DUF58 domain-containing protein n=1 Tax=Mariniblastus fucicola TaxID=980251 RepID=A0A5B9PGH6_9BACT|nr:DUF58 domain-containing protein [Mariniblastus fucicola]QEG24360.1 hypothetical protein MFFC18_42790 [Mariniblastus fucicola]